MHHTRAWGGTLATARPHARIYLATSLHKRKTVFAPTTPITPGPDLPLITYIEDWARLLQTHIHRDFAAIANLHGTNQTCPPVTDSSAAALITLDTIQHYVYVNWQGTLEVQDCLAGIFRLLHLEPSVSLLQQQEIDQMLYLGEAPQH